MSPETKATMIKISKCIVEVISRTIVDMSFLITNIVVFSVSILMWVLSVIVMIWGIVGLIGTLFMILSPWGELVYSFWYFIGVVVGNYLRKESAKWIKETWKFTVKYRTILIKFIDNFIYKDYNVVV